MLAVLAQLIPDAGYQSPTIDWHALAPEIVLSIGGCLLILLDAAKLDRAKPYMPALANLVLLGALIPVITLAVDGTTRVLFDGSYVVDPMAAEALDLLLMLHADHEQNASTSTVRLAGSTGTNPYAAISAGVSALWGPAHGGANEAVLQMLEDIGTVDNIQKFLARVKDKDGNTRLMGFGHRVYKNFDPRAKIIREMCHKVLSRLGQNDNPLFELALRLEEIALKDEYFIARKLYPNVDFYSGIIYSALNIPRSMFTVMFAIARTAGWVAHWQEMIGDPAMKIGRPRQLYTGPTQRDYVDVDKRG